MGTAGSLLQNGTIKKALVMVGNTQSEYASYEDRSMYLLLGDAGTVTALEYSEEDYDEMNFNYLTDGSGRASVIVPDGGSRNPVNDKSLFWKITVMGLRGLDYKRKWMVQRSFHSQFIMYLKILKIYVSELILIKRL